MTTKCFQLSDSTLELLDLLMESTGSESRSEVLCKAIAALAHSSLEDSTSSGAEAE